MSEIKQLLVYAGDDRQNGQFCGPESILLIKRALYFISEHPEDMHIIHLAAGIKPGQSWKKHFSAVMKKELEKRIAVLIRSGTLSKPPIVHAVPPYPRWGTTSETLAAAEVFKNIDCGTIHVVVPLRSALAVRDEWKRVGRFKVSYVILWPKIVCSLVLKVHKLIKPFLSNRIEPAFEYSK